MVEGKPPKVDFFTLFNLGSMLLFGFLVFIMRNAMAAERCSVRKEPAGPWLGQTKTTFETWRLR
jgi:hypothetical protein